MQRWCWRIFLCFKDFTFVSLPSCQNVFVAPKSILSLCPQSQEICEVLPIYPHICWTRQTSDLTFQLPHHEQVSVLSHYRVPQFISSLHSCVGIPSCKMPPELVLRIISYFQALESCAVSENGICVSGSLHQGMSYNGVDHEFHVNESTAHTK